LRNHQDFNRLPRHTVDQRRPTRQLGKFSHERSRSVAHDRFGIVIADPLGHVDLT
jgi:hypothetical protein